LSSNSFGI